MSEQQAGGSIDRDEETDRSKQRDTPTADEVLTRDNGIDEAAEKAKDPVEPMIGNIKKRDKGGPSST